MSKDRQQLILCLTDQIYYITNSLIKQREKKEEDNGKKRNKEKLGEEKERRGKIT